MTRTHDQELWLTPMSDIHHKQTQRQMDQHAYCATQGGACGLLHAPKTRCWCGFDNLSPITTSEPDAVIEETAEPLQPTLGDRWFKARW